MMTNPSTRKARALIDALLRSGVDEVVLAPGSRNGPISIALAQASALGRIRLHVRVDERSASFLALGLAKRAGSAVAMVCTSGTAAAHFHAAAFEASEAGVPLLLLTADRPDHVRGKGANQAIDQVGMFGRSVRASFSMGEEQADAQWRGLIAQAVTAACGTADLAPGAVHINLPFAEPLVPVDGDDAWVETLPTVAPRRLAVDAARGAWSRIWPAGGATPRGVVITSDPAAATDVMAFAQTLGWPILAEPGSGARVGANAIQRYRIAVSDPALRPDVVVTVGRFALSRPVAAFVRSAGRHVTVGRATSDPLGTADVQIARLPDVSPLTPTEDDWLAAWRQADSEASAVPPSTAERFISEVLAHVTAGDLVWYGPSSMIRYAETVAPCFDDVVCSFINRGTNGIDGVVSSALGATLAHQRAGGGTGFALMGDLTFIHDINGLLIEQQSPRPDLVFIVVDSNGGRIFETLEQGRPEYARVFSRVYGTPHNLNLAALAGAYGVAAETAFDSHSLNRALHDARVRGGVSLIVIDDRE